MKLKVPKLIKEPQRFEVEGVDEESGLETTLVLFTSTRLQAERQASKRGVRVKKINGQLPTFERGADKVAGVLAKGFDVEERVSNRIIELPANIREYKTGESARGTRFFCWVCLFTVWFFPFSALIWLLMLASASRATPSKPDEKSQPNGRRTA